MKMLYPRKIGDVLWHSATRRVPKSIFVKIPRLPTIRVIGSQFISTNLPGCPAICFSSTASVPIRGSFINLRLVGSLVIPGCKFGTWMPPLRLFIHRPIGQRPERPNRLAIGADRRTGNSRAWGVVHERHEFVRETGHGTADADAADVGTASNPGHPAPLRYIAVHHRSPAAKLHDALGRAVGIGEVALLV